jgi:hypothetical protein
MDFRPPPGILEHKSLETASVSILRWKGWGISTLLSLLESTNLKHQLSK